MVAAAAAKSLQSCPTLCDPIDGSPPGSAVPGILQAIAYPYTNFPSSSALPLTSAPRDHLPIEAPAPKSLSQALLWGHYLTLSPEVTLNVVHMWGWGDVSTEHGQAVVEKLRGLSGGSELSA